MIERLESRRLLTVVVTQSGSAITVDGGNTTNDLSVIENNGNVDVYDLGVSGSPVFSAGGITAITILGDAKADRIFYTGNSVGAQIFAQSGNDEITVDDTGSGSSSADGEGDADILVVLHANNTSLYGGGGADQIIVQDSVGTGVMRA
jgi:hypothetical protein